MSMQYIQTIVTPAASANAIATAQNTTAATPLTLTSSPYTMPSGITKRNGQTAALALKVTLGSAANFSGVNFVIVGTNNGVSVTETLVGPAAGATATSVYAYTTVASITPSGSVASDVTAGYGSAVATPLPMDYRVTKNFLASMAVTIVSGSPTYTVQHSQDNPFALNYSAETASWFNHTFLTSQTVSSYSNLDWPVSAVRILVSGASTVRFNVNQIVAS